MIIAVASGKGGTGKTTVALSLAAAFDSPIQLLDCDVEEPNLHLFLRGAVQEEETVTVLVPVVDKSLCTSCGDCSEFCAYNAIACFEHRQPIIFQELCHSCGGCSKVCSRGAIREVTRRVGTIKKIQTDGAISLIEGRLDVGQASAVPVIQAVKAHLHNDLPAILDAPPGTSCPVVATLKGADFVLLVAEESSFGLHDLKLSVDMVRSLDIPFAVLLNRESTDSSLIRTFCSQEQIQLLLGIPEDRRIAEACSRGELLLDALPEYRPRFQTLLSKLNTGKYHE